jgi:hypothetical protein
MISRCEAALSNTSCVSLSLIGMFDPLRFRSRAGQSRRLTDASPGSKRSSGRRVHPQRLSVRVR